MDAMDTEGSSLIRPADGEVARFPKKDLAASRSRSSGDKGSGVKEARLPS